MKVRTRVAPSPTGDPHVGTAYTALVNYCFAKKAGGDFVLRIEDTDRARSTEAYEAGILESLQWFGVRWDEGPDVGGAHGPYRQSERTARYQQAAQDLLAAGHAFRCYCEPERLAAMREQQRLAHKPPSYDGKCLSLEPAELRANEGAQRPSVVRMKVPRTGTCVVNDLLRGPIEIAWDTVDMQVLLKSDGMPTYHLANVVDDHGMEITHVLRGEEWVSSAPKHLLLYEYFGWEPPQLGHLPLLRNPDRSKLSKRKNPTGIAFYRQMGYLPEALFNFLGLLMVSSSEGEEMLSAAQLVERFDLSHISLGGPVFDTGKLDWLNARYIRETLAPDEFLQRVVQWRGNPAYLQRIAPLAQARIERFSDLGPLLSFLFAGRLDLTAEQLHDAKFSADEVRKALQLALWRFDVPAEWSVPEIESALRSVGDILKRKFRELVRPFYVAITGNSRSIPLFDAMELLGRDLCRERVRTALDLLGGASAAEQKIWQRELRDARGVEAVS